MQFVTKIRLSFWLILALIVSGLLWLAIIPTGKITYSGLPGHSYFLKKLAPAERVDQEKIIGDPVYFSLQAPRKFDQAQIVLQYEEHNFENLPIIEMGVLADSQKHYDFKPVENKILDNLAWPKIQEKNLTLYQRSKQFNSVEEFLQKINILDPNKIATYNHALERKFLLPDYEPKQEKRTIDFALRGPFQFLTYVKNEPLDFQFTVSDLNKNKESDPVEVNVYRDEKPIFSKRLEDDGIVGDSGRVKEDRKMELNLKNLPEGVYKIELKAGDDIVVKNITTISQKLAFVNKIWIADAGKKDFKVYSDSKLISAQTTNPGRLQKIKIGNEILGLKNTFDKVSLKTDYKLKEISLEKDDIILAGNGNFSFSAEEFFDPAIRKINNSTEVDQDGVDFILADYNPPAGNQIKTAVIDFDLANAYRDNGKYGFLISVPGLLAEDGGEDNLVIKNIEVRLKGKNIFEFLRKKL